MKRRMNSSPKLLILLASVLIVAMGLTLWKTTISKDITGNKFVDETGFSYTLPTGWTASSGPRFSDSEGDNLKKRYGQITPLGDFTDQIITSSNPPQSLPSGSFSDTVLLNVKDANAFYAVTTNSQISVIEAYVSSKTHLLRFAYESTDLKRTKLEDFPYYKEFIRIVESVRF